MPKGKPSPSRRLGQLKRFIHEAVEMDRQERKRHDRPEDPVAEGQIWPEITGDVVAARASREQGTPEKSRRQLIERLKAFKYPYPHGTIKKGTTFFSHIQKLGLLNFLTAPPLLWKVRMAWFIRSTYEREKELKSRKQSQYGHPVAFHRRMMLEEYSHIKRLIKIASEYKVPHKWITEYRLAILKELLREAAVVYPEFLRWSKPNSKISPIALAVDTQVDIFDAISTELAERKMVNNQLAIQLTALICSSHNCVTTLVLDPTPQTVRQNLRDKGRKV